MDGEEKVVVEGEVKENGETQEGTAEGTVEGNEGTETPAAE